MSSKMVARGKLKQEAELLDCLSDKSYATYQRIPDFAEVVAIVNKFGKLFKLTPLGFAALEQALDHESDNSGLDECAWKRSTTLNNLYMELLANFGRSIKQFDRRWNNSKTPPIDSEILNASDVCQFSSIQKISVIRTFLNAILYTERVQNALESWDADDLRVRPFVLDENGHKLWYFGDTYLFLESTPNSAVKRRKTKSQLEFEASSANSFVGGAFALICRNSDDWRRLIDAYRARNEWDLAIKLAEKCEHIRVIENARLKEEMRNSATLRTSSRVQQKLEEKKRQEALEKQRKDEEKRRREEEIKKLLEEKNKDAFEQKEAIDNLLASRRQQDDSVASREERRLQREQRRLQESAAREQRAVRLMSTKASVTAPANGDHVEAQSSENEFDLKISESDRVGPSHDAKQIDSTSNFTKNTSTPKRRGRPCKSSPQLSPTSELEAKKISQSWYELCNTNSGTSTTNNHDRVAAREETSLLDEYLQKPTYNSANCRGDEVAPHSNEGDTISFTNDFDGQSTSVVGPAVEDIRNYGPLSYSNGVIDGDTAKAKNHFSNVSSTSRKPSIFGHSKNAVGASYYCYRNGSNSTIVDARGTSALLLSNSRQQYQPSRYAVNALVPPHAITYAANRDHNYSGDAGGQATRKQPQFQPFPQFQQMQYRQIQPKPFVSFRQNSNQDQTFQSVPNGFQNAPSGYHYNNKYG